MRTIHFISDLPRAGSTLLANLMAQHPDCFVTPTSGCHETMFQLRNTWMNWKEHQADQKASAPHNLVRMMGAMLQAYHDTDKPMVIDKARSWLHSIEMAEAALGRQAKIIVPVRDTAEILASFESLYRKNAHLSNVPGEFLASHTTEGRVRHWASAQGELGIAFNRLKDALLRGYHDRLLFVEFNDLTHNPESTMQNVWDFLEMDVPKHDFNNVKQTTQEDDRIHGYLDMHKISTIVKPAELKGRRVLGDKLWREFSASEFWRN
jgi:sulfotransferase